MMMMMMKFIQKLWNLYKGYEIHTKSEILTKSENHKIWNSYKIKSRKFWNS